MDFNENKPIYLQITDGIMDEILGGVYPPEGRLLSVREYAAKVEVNANTVMRSYDWLQQQGIIFNKRGIGFFVMPDAGKKIIEMRKTVFFQEEATYFFGRLSSFGMTPEDVAALYSDFLSATGRTYK
ncbi:MAG: GntR family transcriptional regulator [Muribaculaceae bacterium]|nr:GntR family transcriptional regulator [Muribaculaceae bacterium]